ncbi:hypothetical protein [Acinetobacter bohemicus]|uniref:hypothetical protein n=1 Tax=Acinetobacter bohemicus TaxID=1435036 RepID=UPI00192C4AAD|nr:hypothetical protein [Acinetobacter bohemicus]CAD9194537.1 hypothetical protein QAC21B_00627 [Acinetobacter bohemicus]
MSNRFYLACFRDNVGSSVGWHCIDGRGYSTNIDKAHVYTLEEAQEELNQAREIDLPISADHVDALVVWKVDHQYIPNESQVIDGISQYVAFERGGIEGRYDGNDVYWLNTESCSTSTDFDKASVMGASKAKALDPCYIVVPFETANKFKRRTFDKDLFNPLVMIQDAGLKIPKHLKKLRRDVKKLRVELENAARSVGAPQ